MCQGLVYGRCMSTRTLVAGYPCHAVATYSVTFNQHGVRLTTWSAACGATGDIVCQTRFNTAGSARKAELCRACFPAGHATYHPAAVKVPAQD